MKWEKYLFLILILFSSACSKKTHQIYMYGIPVHNTGLSETNCKDICETSGLKSKSFSPEQIVLMQSFTNTIPIQEILENPYDLELETKAQAVCAVIIEDAKNKTYHLETFNTKEEAIQSGAIVTHIDACGACSTLKDLSVYAENLDLGADVRKCAMKNFLKPLDSLLECIECIGFTRPCAQIWAYNTRNTQSECFAVCMANNKYNKKDGRLSKCLQCDEDKSGAIFKSVAGRTRRNTGIANSICRFCDEVEFVEHNYPFK